MKHIFFTICLFFGFSANASLLDQIEAKSGSLKAWEADFQQVTEVDLLGQSLTKTGTIQSLRPDSFRIHYVTAPVKTYLYNGKKLWVHQHKSESVIEYREPKNWISSEALSFLSGMQQLSTLFTEIELNEAPDYAFQKKSLKPLALVPLQPGGSIMYLVLGVNSTHDIEEAFLWTPSGNRSHYVFSNIKTNPKLDSKLFSWKKKRGIKVIKK